MFMGYCCKKCGITEGNSFGSGLDLNKGNAPIFSADDGIYGMVINEWNINVHSFFEHEPNDPVLNSLPKSCGVTKGCGHKV